MQFTHLVSSRHKSQSFNTALNKGINNFLDPLNAEMQKKVDMLSVKQK